jgi:hypothetical protein
MTVSLRVWTHLQSVDDGLDVGLDGLVGELGAGQGAHALPLASVQQFVGPWALSYLVIAIIAVVVVVALLLDMDHRGHCHLHSIYYFWSLILPEWHGEVKSEKGSRGHITWLHNNP